MQSGVRATGFELLSAMPLAVSTPLLCNPSNNYFSQSQKRQQLPLLVPKSRQSHSHDTTSTIFLHSVAVTSITRVRASVSPFLSTDPCTGAAGTKSWGSSVTGSINAAAGSASSSRAQSLAALSPLTTHLLSALPPCRFQPPYDLYKYTHFTLSSHPLHQRSTRLHLLAATACTRRAFLAASGASPQLHPRQPSSSLRLN